MKIVSTLHTKTPDHAMAQNKIKYKQHEHITYKLNKLITKMTATITTK